MEPVGHQFNFEDAQLEWIGKPFTEEGKKEAEHDQASSEASQASAATHDPRRGAHPRRGFLVLSQGARRRGAGDEPQDRDVPVRLLLSVQKGSTRCSRWWSSASADSSGTCGVRAPRPPRSPRRIRSTRLAGPSRPRPRAEPEEPGPKGPVVADLLRSDVTRPSGMFGEVAGMSVPLALLDVQRNLGNEVDLRVDRLSVEHAERVRMAATGREPGRRREVLLAERDLPQAGSRSRRTWRIAAYRLDVRRARVRARRDDRRPIGRDVRRQVFTRRLESEKYATSACRRKSTASISFATSASRPFRSGAGDPAGAAAATRDGTRSRNARIGGGSAAWIFANALRRSAWNGVPVRVSRSDRLK